MKLNIASLSIIKMILITIILSSLSACWPFDDDKSTNTQDTKITEPTASFSSSLQTGKAPLDITFTDSSSSGSATITTWLWDFGDGSLSNEQNPQYIFTTPGSYDISLTVTTDDGSNTEVKTAAIIVEAADIKTKITLIDERGLPIEGATASSQDFSIETQQYNQSKQLEINFRPIESTGIIRIEKSGYMTGILYLESILGKSTHVITLLKRAAKITFNSFDGATIVGKDGASVNIPAESLVRPDGSLVTGDVDVYITPLNIKDPLQAQAFPGAFIGQPLGTNPMEAEIISYGVVDIIFMEGDTKLQLKEGSSADIDLPLYATIHPNGEAIQIGDSIPFWILNEATGIWLQESLGIVVTNPLSPQGFSIRAATSHFSTFNADFYSGTSGGGGSGISGNIDFEICDITINLIGAIQGQEMTLDFSMKIFNWGLISRSRTFIYQNQQLDFELVKGLTMDYNISQNQDNASEKIHCASNEDSKIITMVLTEKEPEFTSWLTEVKPIFTKNQTSGLYEITENTVLIGANFIGATSGDITTELINHPLSLPPMQKFESLYQSTDTNPVVIDITLTNEFGSVEESTTIDYISSQSPTIDYFYANPKALGSSIEFAWETSGADEISVYYLGDDPSALGTIVFRISGADIDTGKTQNGQLIGLEGYIRIEFSNQYGNTVIIGKLGTMKCIVNSELCSGPPV